MSSEHKPEHGEGGGREKYVYFVDGAPYRTESRYLTGAQIKAQIPDFNPGYQLVREGRQGQPDQIVTDSDTVDLDCEPPVQFYIAPPATFG